MIVRFPTRLQAARDAGPNGNTEQGDGAQDEFSAGLLAALPKLRRYAIALLRDVTMADDLVQDCIERALRNRGSLIDPNHMSGWLNSILHNLYLDSLRQKRRRGAHVELEDSMNLIELSVPPADRGAAKDLVEAMSDLSVEHRQVLLLVGLEGYSYRDVADQLDIPIGTVMSRLARARSQLRARLEETEPTKEPLAGPWPDKKTVCQNGS